MAKGVADNLHARRPLIVVLAKCYRWDHATGQSIAADILLSSKPNCSARAKPRGATFEHCTLDGTSRADSQIGITMPSRDSNKQPLTDAAHIAERTTDVAS